MKKLSLLVTCLVCTNIAIAAPKPIAIIAPMPSESDYTKSHIKNLQPHRYGNMSYFTGKIANQPVVFINSGIGKVSAAVTTTWLHYFIHPKLIILEGSAGDVSEKFKKIGDVVVGDRVFDADYGQLTPNGPTMIAKIYDPNRDAFPPTYFNPGKQFHSLLEKAIQASQKTSPEYNFGFGTIVTTDALPNPAWQTKLFLENKVDVVAMEDAAVDKVCWMYRMLCINIRGVSNVAGVPQTDAATILAANNAASVAVNFISKVT